MLAEVVEQFGELRQMLGINTAVVFLDVGKFVVVAFRRPVVMGKKNSLDLSSPVKAFSSMIKGRGSGIPGSTSFWI